MKNIVWIPGWASNFSIWEHEIIELSRGDFCNQFLNYDEMRDEAAMTKALARADIIVAWSMGSLQLMNSLLASSGQREKFGLIILCSPFLDFCDGVEGWPAAVISRMVRVLKKDKKAVLTQFVANMGAVEQRYLDSWLEYAMGLSTESLVEGLEVLKNKKLPVFDGLLSNLQEFAPQHMVIHSGEQDQVVKHSLISKFIDSLGNASFEALMLPHGHWPDIKQIFIDINKRDFR